MFKGFKANKVILDGASEDYGRPPEAIDLEEEEELAGGSCLLSEFLKITTVRPHKIFQRLHKISIFKHKKSQITTVSLFWVIKKKEFFCPFCPRKTCKQKTGSLK